MWKKQPVAPLEVRLHIWLPAAPSEVRLHIWLKFAVKRTLGQREKRICNSRKLSQLSWRKKIISMLSDSKLDQAYGDMTRWRILLERLTGVIISPLLFLMTALEFISSSVLLPCCISIKQRVILWELLSLYISLEITWDWTNWSWS